MSIDDKRAGRDDAQQEVVRVRFAPVAGRRLREATDCRFSFLPYAELVRVASEWFDACAEAHLSANPGPIEDWLRGRAKTASDEGFELEDLLKLLRLCREAAMETEGWVDEELRTIDEIIDESLAGLREQIAWDIPEGLNYVSGKSAAEREAEQQAAAAAVKEEPRGERRAHTRAQLKLPIRVRGWAGEQVDEVIDTEDVGRGGVRFLSRKKFVKGFKIRVVYPFWEDPGAVNKEYPAEVVRVEKRDEGYVVAIQFLVNLGD